MLVSCTKVVVMTESIWCSKTLQGESALKDLTWPYYHELDDGIRMCDGGSMIKLEPLQFI